MTDAADIIGSAGDALAQDFGKASSSLFTVRYGTVQTDHGDGTLDVALGGSVLRGVPMTTACRGVKVADRVIVQTYARLSTVTGVLAHDNDPYVKVYEAQVGSGYARIYGTPYGVAMATVMAGELGISNAWQRLNVATVPAGYRPPNVFRFPATCQNADAQFILEVSPSGAVDLVTLGVGFPGNNWISAAGAWAC